MCIRDSDYITKPFSMVVLHKRIEAVFRRSGGEKSENLYNDGYLFINFDSLTAHKEGQPLTLTPTEFKPVSYTHLDVYKRQKQPAAVLVMPQQADAAQNQNTTEEQDPCSWRQEKCTYRNEAEDDEDESDVFGFFVITYRFSLSIITHITPRYIL